MGRLCAIFIVVILTSFKSLYSQNTGESERLKKIKSFDQKGWALRKTYPDSTLYYTDLIIDLLKASGDTSNIAKYYNYKGIGYYYKGDNYTSYGFYTLAYETARALGDSIQYAHSMNNLGRFFASQGNYVKAFDYANRALKVFVNMDYKDGIAYSQKRISEVYVAQGYFDKALRASKKALAIRIEYFDKNNQATAHIDLANVYLSMDSLKESQTNYLHAREKALDISNDVLKATSELGLSEINIRLTNYDSAIYYAQMAKEIADNINNQDLLNQSLVQLGKALFFGERLLESKNEFEEVLRRSIDSNQLEYQRDAYYYLAKINARLGLGMKAYENQLKFDGLDKQLNNTQDKRAIDSLLFKDEIRQRAKENELLVINIEKDKELIATQKWKNNLVIITSLSILLGMVVIYFNSRKTVKANKLLLKSNKEILAQKEEIKANLEQKKILEEKLISSNVRLEAVLNSGYVSIISTDTEGLITHFSRGAENLLGYHAEEMVGKQTPAIIHDLTEVIERGIELSEELGKEIEGFRVFVELADRLGFESREWTYIRKNGERFPVQLVVSALKDEFGNTYGYIGIATDITEQKDIEDQLRVIAEQNRYFKDILESVEDLIYELDPDGNYKYVNPATTRISKYSVKELLGKHYTDLLDPETIEEVKSFYKNQVVNKTEFTHREVLIRNKNNEPLWIHQSVKMIFAGDKIQRVLVVGQDITEFKKLRVELENQLEIHKLVTDNSYDLVILYNTDGSKRYVSPSVEKLLGYTPEEYISIKSTDIIHPEDAHLIKWEKDYFKNKTEKKFEARLLSKDGRYRWFEMVLTAIYNKDGSIKHYQGSSRDISDKKVILDKVEESEANLIALIENTTDVIFAVDSDLKILTYNDAFKKGLKYLANVSVRKGMRVDKGYPDSRTKNLWIGNFMRALKGERFIANISYSTKPNRLEFEYYFNPIISKKEVIGVSVFGRDVTKRNAEERKVKRYQEGLRLINTLSATEGVSTQELFEVALEVVGKYLDLPLGIISEIDGDTYQVKYCYDDLTGDLETGAEFDFNSTYCDLTYQKNQVIAISHMKESNYNGHPCYEKFQLESYIGAIIYVGNKKYGTVNFSSPNERKEKFDELDEDFITLFSNWIGANIVRHETTLKLQREKEKAELASKAKADFLSVMSHEIRTPLNGILGLTNILMNGSPRQDQLSHLNLLKFSGDNLLVIINDILDFNKIEAGKINLEKVDFDLYGLCTSIRQTNEFKISEKSIDLILEYDQNLPNVFIGDSVRLGQVVNNLVSNAIKFTDKGFVKISVTRVGDDENGIRFKVAIQDTGKGIDPKNHKKIFERFSQEDDSTTRLYGGTGLGLSISKRLLELMDSDIELESELGKGSIFSFKLTLPIGKKLEATTSERVEFSSLEEFNLKVLIADDNDINYIIASNYLNDWGVACDHATDGNSAVKMTLENDYDVILMDLQMPNKNGYEASEELRSQHIELPIVALTASALDEIRIKAEASGMNAFLTKPINPRELYEKLIELLDIKIDSKVISTKVVNRKQAAVFEKVLDNMSKGDVTFKNELIRLFSENLKELREVYSQAINDEDIQKARDIKHKSLTAISMLELSNLLENLRRGISYLDENSEFDKEIFLTEISDEVDNAISELKMIVVKEQ